MICETMGWTFAEYDATPAPDLDQLRGFLAGRSKGQADRDKADRQRALQRRR